MGLPDSKQFEDLLGTKQGAAKKGAMKTASAVSRAGAIRRVNATHLGDGKPLTLTMQVRVQQLCLLARSVFLANQRCQVGLCKCIVMHRAQTLLLCGCALAPLQAMSYDQGGRVRRVVRLQLVQPVSAALDKLLALRDGKEAATHTGLDAAGAGEGAAAAPGSVHSHSSRSSDSQGGSDHKHGARLAAELPAGNGGKSRCVILAVPAATTGDMLGYEANHMQRCLVTTSGC